MSESVKIYVYDKEPNFVT